MILIVYNKVDKVWEAESEVFHTVIDSDKNVCALCKRHRECDHDGIKCSILS
jgi:hypothetical protein